jgi:hypothetical protein
MHYGKQDDIMWGLHNGKYCLIKILKLTAESYSSESSDNERPESPEIALIIDVTDEATPETQPSYYLSTSSTIYSKCRPEY